MGWESIGNYLHSTRADEGLSSARWYLRACLRHASKVIAVTGDVALAGREANGIHEDAVGGCSIFCQSVGAREAPDFLKHILLVLFQPHDQILVIWSGTRLKTMFISPRRSGVMAHRSA